MAGLLALIYPHVEKAQVCHLYHVFRDSKWAVPLTQNAYDCQ